MAPIGPASRRRHGLAVALAVLLAVLAGTGMASTGALRGMERQTLGARFALRPATAPADVAVVAIDDATFDAVYPRRWPFPRSWHARLVDRLRRAGARAIVYDVQFTEASANPRQDFALYDALGRAGGAVLATSEMNARGQTRVLGGDGNLRRIHSRAGAANLSPDPDGFVARFPYAHSRLPSLAVATAERLTGRRVDRAPFSGGGAWIDYRGGPGTIPTLSFASVLRGRFDARAVRGRVVVVGTSAPTLQDVHATPTSGTALMSGPEIQANAIWTALHGFPLRAAPAWTGLLAILLLALAPAAARLRLRVLGTAAAAVAAAAAYVVLAQVAFDRGWIVAVVPPLTALVIATLGTIIASHLSESRARHWLSRHTELLEDTVRARTAELRRTQLEVLERLGQAAESRDGETGEHIRRIGVLAEQLALVLGMPAAEAELLRHASALHDVGKVGVPDRILLKPGKLDAEEWAAMRTHTTMGAGILAGSGSPLVQLAEEIARTHHERWDGTGYPAGLAGEDIPLSGRIVAVVDVFDALRSERPYKRAWSYKDTLAELKRGRGTHFDPHVLDAFLGIAAAAERATRDELPGWEATVPPEPEPPHVPAAAPAESSPAG